MVRKVKTPAGMLAIQPQLTMLPRLYYRLGVTSCQAKSVKNGARGAESRRGKSKPAAYKAKAAVPGERGRKIKTLTITEQVDTRPEIP